MPEIHIAFDLPDFHDSFVWEAKDDEWVALDGHMQDLAAKAGVPRDALAHQAMRQARELLRNPNPVSHRGAQVMITDFVLRLPTGRSDKPGTLGDYLAAYDFEVTFTKLDGEAFEYDVGACERDDIAGSA